MVLQVVMVMTLGNRILKKEGEREFLSFKDIWGEGSAYEYDTAISERIYTETQKRGLISKKSTC